MKPIENITGFEPDPKASTQPIKQDKAGNAIQPKKPKTESTNRSSNNSFGPRRPNTSNDRRSN
jgi:ATP-dependent RNA helicase RhlE